MIVASKILHMNYTGCLKTESHFFCDLIAESAVVKFYLFIS